MPFSSPSGLLLVSVTSVTRLFEEAGVAGSLDVLLVTPLPTPGIVSGKWWATYRTVVLLAVLRDGRLACRFGGSDGSGTWALPLLVTLMLAYGAFVHLPGASRWPHGSAASAWPVGAQAVAIYLYLWLPGPCWSWATARWQQSAPGTASGS